MTVQEDTLDSALGAGASARAEYQRRGTAHRARVQANRPVILVAGVTLAIVGLALWASNAFLGASLIVVAVAFVLGRLFVVPNTVTAWGVGADGELRTARRLAELGPDYVVLHDRRIPGAKANIDHIVVGPSGVFVVESKSLRGTLSIRGNDVYVDGRRRTGMLDEARREGLAVRMAFDNDDAGVPVTLVICVHRARLPLFKSAVDAVSIVSGSGLVHLIRTARPVLDAQTVLRVAELLGSRLRPAAG